jgi:hypothetical protein
MSGSEPDRWGPRQSLYGGENPGVAEPTDNSPGRRGQVTDQTIALLADALAGQLQSQLDRMAEDLSVMKAHVKQAGIDAEEAITAALEDILARLDRGVETTTGNRQEGVLAHLQESVNELTAKAERESNDPTRGEDIGPVLARLEIAVNELTAKAERESNDPTPSEDIGPALPRLETTVNGLATKAELERDTLEAVTRIESAVSGLADEGRNERRSLVVRLDQLLETVQGTHAGSGSTGAGDRDQLIEKLDRLAEQVESLRRRVALRVALRARPEPVMLDDSTVAAVGEAVADALAAALANRSGASRNPRTPAAAAPTQGGPDGEGQAGPRTGTPDSSDT